MKHFFVTMVMLGCLISLNAAETVFFSYQMNGTTERVNGNGPITASQNVTATRNENNEWGMGLTIEPKKAKTDVLYRIRLEVDGASQFFFKDHVLFPDRFDRFPAGKGTITFFGFASKEKNIPWEFRFEKRTSQIKIKQLTVEEISPSEYGSNLLVNDGLEPGFWRGIWGKRDGCLPKLIETEISSAGEILHFDAGKQGDGWKTTFPLPFLPERKYEISFWIRSNNPEIILWQLVRGGISHTRLALKKEWSEVRMTGVTPKQLKKGGMMLMFFRTDKKQLPEFEIGGVDFHYIDNSTK